MPSVRSNSTGLRRRNHLNFLPPSVALCWLGAKITKLIKIFTLHHWRMFQTFHRVYRAHGGSRGLAYANTNNRRYNEKVTLLCSPTVPHFNFYIATDCIGKNVFDGFKYCNTFIFDYAGLLRTSNTDLSGVQCIYSSCAALLRREFEAFFVRFVEGSEKIQSVTYRNSGFGLSHERSRTLQPDSAGRLPGTALFK